MCLDVSRSIGEAQRLMSAEQPPRPMTEPAGSTSMTEPKSPPAPSPMFSPAILKGAPFTRVTSDASTEPPFTTEEQNANRMKRVSSSQDTLSDTLELFDDEGSVLGEGSRGRVRIEQTIDGHLVAAKAVTNGTDFAPRVPEHLHVCTSKRAHVRGEYYELRRLCVGGELFDAVAEASIEGDIDSEQALGWTRDLLSAVAHVHRHGVAHGQLRPEHALLDGEGRVVLLACRHRVADADADAVDATTDDAAAALASSAAEAADAAGDARPAGGRVTLRRVSPLDAPELQGLTEVDLSVLRAADVWACGVLVASLFAAAPPFAAADAKTCDEFAAFAARGTLDALPRVAAAAPAALHALLASALAPDPARRPAAAALLAEVEAIRKGAGEAPPSRAATNAANPEATPPLPGRHM